MAEASANTATWRGMENCLGDGIDLPLCAPCGLTLPQTKRSYVLALSDCKACAKGNAGSVQNIYLVEEELVTWNRL